MFAKPYKVKCTNTLKNSEKKQLVQRVIAEFSAPEERVKELIPNKATTCCSKLALASGQVVGLYIVDGVPLLIEVEEMLLPTLRALWAAPDLVPTVTIHAPVLSKMSNGATLFAAGVVVPPLGAGLPPFPQFPPGAALAANTTDNGAAAAVGRALASSADVLMKAAGPCAEPVHVYGDQLCRDARFPRADRPALPPSPHPPPPPHTGGDGVGHDQLQITSKPTAIAREEWPSLTPRAAAATPSTVTPPAAPDEPRLIPDPPEATVIRDADAEHNNNTDVGVPDPSVPPADMDGLLRWCLLTFLALHGATTELPLKTNLLYRNHMVPLCPPDRSLDVKKSTHKKMSRFLDEMQKEGVIEVREVDKGVAAVTAVSLSHPLVRRHKVSRPECPAPVPPPAGTGTGYTPPGVTGVFCVTAKVAPLFPGIKKGSALSGAEVRAAVTRHVASLGLQPMGTRAPSLDAALAAVLGRQQQEVVKWEDVMSGVTGAMTAATLLTFADGGQQLIRARLEPITMKVVTRSGNKKVTLVSNLESYGFNLPALSHSAQLAVGASCGVTRSPGARSDQLMLQGDQTHYVTKLLVEKYGLPKKFVENADKYLKKKH